MTSQINSPLQHPAGREVNIKRLSGSNNDLSYWLNQTPEDRLSALEYLREQYSKL